MSDGAMTSDDGKENVYNRFKILRIVEAVLCLPSQELYHGFAST